MEKFKNEFNTLTLFPTGICNLQCRYCGIDKNPALLEIDQKLGESFQGDYYIEQIRKWFPNKGQLSHVETWGGEPFIHMDRIYHVLNQIIEEYPYFYHFYSSTNFSYPTWTDQLFGLIKQFNKYDYRDFVFQLQLSCDGPEYINDTNRGKGTTKRCLENFYKMNEMLSNYVGPNIHFVITIKPTLDLNSLYALNTKESIIEYYQFFEDTFIRPFREKNNFDNLEIAPPVPNTAVPSPVTKADGIYFADFCKRCREIEDENETNYYFEYYHEITPYDSFRDCYIPSYITVHQPGYTCGVGTTSIGLLPNNLVSSCHEGYTNMALEYKTLAEQSKRITDGTINFDEFIADRPIHLLLNEQKYKTFSDSMHCFNIDNASARLAIIANEIVLLAMAGLIEEKYISEEEAVRAAQIIQAHGVSTCIKDNFNMTGSILLQDHGIIKLLLNGAIDYIYRPEGEQLFNE